MSTGKFGAGVTAVTGWVQAYRCSAAARPVTLICLLVVVGAVLWCRLGWRQVAWLGLLVTLFNGRALRSRAHGLVLSSQGSVEVQTALTSLLSLLLVLKITQGAGARSRWS